MGTFFTCFVEWSRFFFSRLVLKIEEWHSFKKCLEDLEIKENRSLHWSPLRVLMILIWNLKRKKKQQYNRKEWNDIRTYKRTCRGSFIIVTMAMMVLVCCSEWWSFHGPFKSLRSANLDPFSGLFAYFSFFFFLVTFSFTSFATFFFLWTIEFFFLSLQIE